jgi:hypothetical protein
MPDDSYSIKEFIAHHMQDVKDSISEIKKDIKEIKSTGEATDQKVGIQNGRVTKLEEWSNIARSLIENNNVVITAYKTDKRVIIALYGLLIIVSGTIITLMVGAIDTKIEHKVKEISTLNQTGIVNAR